MNYTSSTDNEFLATLEHWLRGQPEILVLVRYSHAAGAKSFEFFSSFTTLSASLRELPARTSVTVFRRPQLPLRGIVDDEFIGSCLSSIRDGSEFLIVETVRRTAAGAPWFHMAAGESHAKLREALEDSRGKPVAVGAYPPWQEGNPDVISAVVPDKRGVVKLGAY